MACDDGDGPPTGSGDTGLSFIAWLATGICLVLAYVLALVLLHPQA